MSATESPFPPFPTTTVTTRAGLGAKQPSSKECSTTVIVLSVVIAVLAIVAIVVGAVYTSKASELQARQASMEGVRYEDKRPRPSGLEALDAEDSIAGALTNVAAQGVSQQEQAQMQAQAQIQALQAQLQAQTQAHAQAQANAQSAMQNMHAQMQAQARQLQAQAQAQQAQAQPQAQQSKGTAYTASAPTPSASSQSFRAFGENLSAEVDKRKYTIDEARDAIIDAMASSGNGLDNGQWQAKPSAAAPLPVPPPVAYESGEPLITAEQAVAMMQDPAKQSTIIVAMRGCPGCERIRKTLQGIFENQQVTAADRIGVLEKSEWMKVMNVFPATQVPALFKAGMGKVITGPIGAQEAGPLLAFIKSSA